MSSLDSLNQYTHGVDHRELMRNGLAVYEVTTCEGIALSRDGGGQCVVWGVPGLYCPQGFCLVECKDGFIGIRW